MLGLCFRFLQGGGHAIVKSARGSSKKGMKAKAPPKQTPKKSAKKVVENSPAKPQAVGKPQKVIEGTQKCYSSRVDHKEYRECMQKGMTELEAMARARSACKEARDEWDASHAAE